MGETWEYDAIKTSNKSDNLKANLYIILETLSNIQRQSSFQKNMLVEGWETIDSNVPTNKPSTLSSQ